MTHLLPAGADHAGNLRVLLVEPYAVYSLEQLLQVRLDDRWVLRLKDGLECKGVVGSGVQRYPTQVALDACYRKGAVPAFGRNVSD